ncbi:carbohydrate ABC transporter permease [Clostridium fallax]|uniref:Carbohydrate ABC transporter membrane protein 2, CUT1 family n=1 Tax=Clostridium fallax TaxID=1533 RepID=A0A1M4TUX6_9CLOT|nr:carbohydrate ABC transporter permease [Clostridium fallax]SHE48243.1 carbohydrate ABC transporter membrane protein 2, CUT1 family [Clostridium fallax]SQB22382.1 ABC transporter permease [Clostridium fallax]
MKVKKNRDSFKTWILRMIMLFFTLIVAVPLIWNISSSLKTSKEFLKNPWALPNSFFVENYLNAITKANMGEYFLNSIYVTVLGLIILVALAVPSAYALARHKFFGKKIIKTVYMAGLFIQSVYIIVPLFLIMNGLKLTDNLTALALVYAVLSLPFSIYILISFMKTLPKDYEEAAYIDGCSNFQMLFKIIVPLAKPGIITVIIFNFMGYWNEYALATTLIFSEKKRTLSVGLQYLMEQQKFATDWGAMFAGLVIVMVPTIIIYCLVHKKLTEGVSIGGVKG